VKVLTSWCLVDDEHNLRIDIPLMLNCMGVADTPENRQQCLAEAAKVLKELFPEIPINADTRETGAIRLHPAN
jgi:hypothetical protein